MTESQRKIFERMAQRYTEANTVTRAVARQTLVREGIRLSDGRLALEYGGKEQPEKTVTPAA